MAETVEFEGRVWTKVKDLECCPKCQYPGSLWGDDSDDYYYGNHILCIQCGWIASINEWPGWEWSELVEIMDAIERGM